MELFYSKTISEGGRVLDAEESGHCIKVLRHRAGDSIHVVDGHGMLYRCTIVDADPRAVGFEVEEWVENYGSHDYWLRMAVCPPKNIDRFEWFAEKATEIGVDAITPLFGDYSERKVFKPERIGRLLVSAAKQSHKGAIPQLDEAMSVKDFLAQDHGGLKLICYCDEATGKIDIKDALRCPVEPGMTEEVKPGMTKEVEPGMTEADAGVRRPGGALSVPQGECSQSLRVLNAPQESPQNKPMITILIGPEGDFSRAEVAMALERGWQPVSLGDSRLRIETAALVATTAVYLHFSK